MILRIQYFKFLYTGLNAWIHDKIKAAGVY